MISKNLVLSLTEKEQLEHKAQNNLFELQLQLFLLLLRPEQVDEHLYQQAFQVLLVFQILYTLLIMTNKVLFHSQSMADLGNSKNSSNIVMEQRLLRLMYIIIWCSSYYFCLIFKIFTCYSFVIIYLTTVTIFNSRIISSISIIILQTS